MEQLTKEQIDQVVKSMSPEEKENYLQHLRNLDSLNRKKERLLAPSKHPKARRMVSLEQASDRFSGLLKMFAVLARGTRIDASNSAVLRVAESYGL